MKKITSLVNLEIKAITALSKTKERYAQKKFVAEGLRTCSTLLEAKMKLVQLYVTEDQLPFVQKICTEQYITLVDIPVSKKISFSHTPSGITGIFEIPQEPLLSTLSEGIILYNISDPGNAGTLIRTCAAMNKKTAVFVEGVDPWHPKVIQASAGTIGFVNIFQVSWQSLVAAKNKLQLCALVASGGKKPDETDFSDILFVIGNEAHGIPINVLKDCDTTLTLEMPGNIESLNAAIAGSIALYIAWHT